MNFRIFRNFEFRKFQTSQFTNFDKFRTFDFSKFVFSYLLSNFTFSNKKKTDCTIFSNVDEFENFQNFDFSNKKN